MPFVELHCHLDGSLNLDKSYELAKKQGLIPTDMTLASFREFTQVSSECTSLEDFLGHFAFPIQLMQTHENLSQLTEATIEDLVRDEVVYAELRFAPQSHTIKGLTQEEVVQAVLEGRNKALKAYPMIHVNLVLCMMTHNPVGETYALNAETVELCARYNDQGVVALDLAGAEGIAPYADYQSLFQRAQALGVPFTIHAGESGPASNVLDALTLGAKRIGHGGHCSQDLAILKKVIEQQIPLEICVTSNIQCHNQPSFEQHIIRSLFDQGACVTFNTDNRRLSNTTMKKEAQILKEKLHFTDSELNKMTENALASAFCDPEEKAWIQSQWAKSV